MEKRLRSLKLDRSDEVRKNLTVNMIFGHRKGDYEGSMIVTGPCAVKEGSHYEDGCTDDGWIRYECRTQTEIQELTEHRPLR